jgi:Fic family protein
LHAASLQIHEHLMHGARGADKQPGIIRSSQNWIGGTRPGNAKFVPPPHEDVPHLLSDLEKWIHHKDKLPPLVRAGLAHVQFETIHPFLDGNGRIGRLLISLLLEHWKVIDSPILYLSLAFKRHRQEYYESINNVRIKGDWESWIEFFLECIKESANDAVDAAGRMFKMINNDRKKLAEHTTATVAAIRLLDRLVEHPIITMPMAIGLIKTSKPTAIKAIGVLSKAGILEEITGKRRDRIYAYRKYLKVLTEDTGITNQSGRLTTRVSTSKNR